MTNEEMLTTVQNLTSDTSVTANMIQTYLNLAADRILRRMYPFGTIQTDVPEQYQMMQCELAVRMIARRGGEGEVSHSEVGVSRTWGSVNDEDILRQIAPCVGVAVL